MHLDMSFMLPNSAIQDIENVASQYGPYYPVMLWPLWLRNVDTKVASVNILQAAAQLISSHGCVLATLRFGLYCSRHFPNHGNVVSDEVALYYLRRAFQSLLTSQEGILEWLQKAEGFEYPKDQRDHFWFQACAAFAQHEYEQNPDHVNSEIEFAFQFLLNYRDHSA